MNINFFRALLLHFLLFLLTFTTFPWTVTSVQAESTPGDRCFAIFRDGSEVGSDCVEFNRRRDLLTVRRSIFIEVGFVGVTFYQYRHEDREFWKNGSFVALETWTNDNGDRYHVRAKRVRDEIIVDTGGSQQAIPGNSIPTSYWNHKLTRRSNWLDTQSGELRTVKVEPAGTKTISLDGDSLPVNTYRVKGDIRLKVGYDGENTWSWLAFEKSGSSFEYLPVKNSSLDWREHSFYKRNPDTSLLHESAL